MTHRFLATSTPAALLLAVGALTTLAGTASAQTSFPEVEPNSVKTEATPVVGIVSGDSITGTTTGTVGTVGLTTLPSVDTFRVKTSALPLAIYRHTLTITTTGTTGHIGTIRGLSQLNGVINPTSDAVFATSTTVTTPPRFNVWYGFGKQEEIYYRLTGTTATTAPYVSTLTTATVTPMAVAGLFNPGSVTVSALNQGHNTDTEIYLYDGALNPIPLGHQDDPIGTVASPSTVTLVLAAGTYYVAIADWNTSNNQSDLSPAEQADDDPLLDFPDAIANNTTGLNVNVQFSVTDGATTTVVPALRANPFEIVWATFTVGLPSTPTTPYCFGDGSGTACPCANAGLPGNGCAHSLNANGAHLAGSGLASIAADSFVLTGSGMPNSSALYFQGTTRVNSGNGAVFGDGLRCAGGTVIRLGTKTNAGGTSNYPSAGDTSISVKGANAAGNVRDYQCWFRNAAAFCTTATFNLTNGLEITWGP
jgi:hypothetical protein